MKENSDPFAVEITSSPVKLTDFFENNYRLFTVIGVFAALSVYFTQLANSDGGARLGVASSLVLFLVVVLVGIYRAMQASEKVLEHDSYKSYLWALPFSIIIFSLISLAGSIIAIVQNRYPEEFNVIILSSLLYAIVVVYLVIVISSDIYHKIGSKTRIGNYYSVAPKLSVIFVIIWTYWRYDVGAIDGLLDASLSYVFGVSMGAIILHALTTLLVLILIKVLDIGVGKVENNDSQNQL